MVSATVFDLTTCGVSEQQRAAANVNRKKEKEEKKKRGEAEEDEKRTRHTRVSKIPKVSIQKHDQKHRFQEARYQRTHQDRRARATRALLQ